MNKNTRGMGSIYRRGNTWWVQYFVRGRRVRESSRSARESDARKLLKRRLGEAATGKPMGPDIEKTTFSDLAGMLLTDYRVNNLRSIDRVEDAICHLRAFFGDDRALSITSDRVSDYIAHRQSEAAANATINRELAALKRAFRLALRARKVALIPEIAMLDETANVREGFIEQAEFLRLREALPAYLKDPIAFLWLTGWRVGEMRSLTWASVYSDAIRLSARHSKNKRARELPLVGELAEIIARARSSRLPHCPFVFHRRGRPIGSFRKTWMTACRRAGLPGLRVHDLRRSAARNLIRAGVPENIAMKFTGHQTSSIFRRYDIVTERDLALAASRLEQHLAAQPTTPKILPLRPEQPQNSHNSATASPR
jgi:integrase